jgi:lysophospholipase L1-like esterase
VQRGTVPRVRHWGQQAAVGAVIRPLRRLRGWGRVASAALMLGLGAGCGSDDEPSADGPQPQTGRTVVAALGDSITAGAPLWDPDPSVRAQISDPDRRSQYGYWAQRALPGTSFRNCGISGQTTVEIAARVDGCAKDADVLIVQGGVNDVAQGRPIEGAAENLRSMVRRGKELGLRVAIVELLPWNGGHPAADGRIRALNRRIGSIGREEGVRVMRWYELLEDPRRPGRMRPRWTDDLAHPSVAGYRRLGEAVELRPP